MFSEEQARRRVGDVLDDRYELRGVLGMGMTGVVYEGWHRYLNRPVAVKVMHPQLVAIVEHVPDTPPGLLLGKHRGGR